jgi:xyloglucan-specific exo-beta-1,4-glucanase
MYKTLNQMNSTKRRLTLAALVLATLCAFGKAQTIPQPYIWRNVKVGAGGFIPGIVFSRVERGLVYLRSDMGGCYRWDRSQKTWIPLQDPMAESSYFGGESIAPDPVDPNTVYIAAGMYRTDPAAMLRSHDRGNTWDVFPVPFRMGGNEDGRGVGERLAVDPNDHTILFFGSRNDGLWRSDDSAQTWTRVSSFPIHGLGTPGNGKPSNTGLSFVVFDPHSGSLGSPTRTIFVGSADPGPQHLFRSDDAGRTWTAVPGAPAADMLPAQAQIDDQRILYLTYGNGTGPNGVTDGAVMKLNTVTGTWTDITPAKYPNHPKGGYCGLSLDRQNPGTLAVATIDRWMPVDTIYRSIDAGKTWMEISQNSTRDVSASPFLLWGKPQAKLGWWMAALAIDPFDSNHVAYSTGATLYATDDFSNVTRGATTHWTPWIAGIEQTAILTLISPTKGAPLLSGFGDIGGFVHNTLTGSPPDMYENPQFNSTFCIDYAELRPSTIVRAGTPNEDQASLGYSLNGGRSWQPMSIPSNLGRQLDNDHPPITLSADGRTFIVGTPIPLFTRDFGKTWAQVHGLPLNARPIPDRVDPNFFYAIDFQNRKILTSSDQGVTFTPSEISGLPTDISADKPFWHAGPWPLLATPGKAHDLWFISAGSLYHSIDGGQDFLKANASLNVQFMSFGKAAPGRDYPSLFVVASQGSSPPAIKAIWRSDDMAVSWTRVNDDQHQYGTRFRCIAGDPRAFGRVYVGTDGRGVLYGEPVGTAN